MQFWTLIKPTHLHIFAYEPMNSWWSPGSWSLHTCNFLRSAFITANFHLLWVNWDFNPKLSILIQELGLNSKANVSMVLLEAKRDFFFFFFALLKKKAFWSALSDENMKKIALRLGANDIFFFSLEGNHVIWDPSNFQVLCNGFMYLSSWRTHSQAESSYRPFSSSFRLCFWEAVASSGYLRPMKALFRARGLTSSCMSQT